MPSRFFLFYQNNVRIASEGYFEWSIKECRGVGDNRSARWYCISW